MLLSILANNTLKVSILNRLIQKNIGYNKIQICQFIQSFQPLRNACVLLLCVPVAACIFIAKKIKALGFNVLYLASGFIIYYLDSYLPLLLFTLQTLVYLFIKQKLEYLSHSYTRREWDFSMLNAESEFRVLVPWMSFSSSSHLVPSTLSLSSNDWHVRESSALWSSSQSTCKMNINSDCFCL